MKTTRFATILTVLFICVSIAGCLPFHRNRDKKVTPLPHLANIAVLPMDRASIRPGQERATCALSDKVFDAQEISPDTADAVTRILFKSVEGDSRFTPIPEGKCMGFLNSLLETDVKTSQIRLIQAFGQELHADAVLYGKLFRYEDRVGSKYAIKKPASVAFTLHLIRVKDGAVLWRYTFDETQQPLSENLFKAKLYKDSGMRWLTAQELAAYGLENAISDLKKRLPKD